MTTLLIALAAAAGYLVAYHTYGRWLSRKIFRLDPQAPVPSVALNDDKDYVPTKKGILFGHHFTSIAGTGPIVGPAIAVIWGWVPALLWVFFGSILVGAVHDLGALVVSMRNRGQTVGDIAGRVLNKRVRVLFLFILFMALTVVLAIFGWVIATVFQKFPTSIFPSMIQIPIAVAIGLFLHRKGTNILIPSLITLAIMYLSVLWGDLSILHELNLWMAGFPIMVWVGMLLFYAYVASVLPVWVLLQPRDYINSLQLISSLGLIVLGLGAAGFFGGYEIAPGVRPPLEIVAPAFQFDLQNTPLVFPFLFITIACGACSGFHCLVSSGTSSKQLRCETDATFVGYGSMLTEGFLAVLVILACVAGLGLGVTAEGKTLVGTEAWASRYANWTAVSQGAIGSFVMGAANFLKALGLSDKSATALMGVFVASFAGTTLDTACRLQRYVIQELAGTFAPRISPTAAASEAYDFDDNLKGADRKTGEARDHQPHALNPLVWLTNKHGATIFAVVLATAIAAIPSSGNWTWNSIGTGGLILWPLFGATNQLLAGLAFLVIVFYFRRRRVPVWFMTLPMVFMLAMPMWAMVLDIGNFWAKERYLLLTIAAITVVLEIWMLFEALLLWPKAEGLLEEALPTLPPASAQPTA